MAFNEVNSVEHYIIHQLTGVNLNSNTVQDMVLNGSINPPTAFHAASMKCW